ncbi:Yip1 family protein [Alteromonas sp. CI.11.F.A3]|uniref:Yip1 family protein n=1 Tax=unclassified Alteromonas TaxID=2614992 RepID=UPI001B3A006F|nr:MULTISPECIES: Yip1 family protein [unclassified Alteromonas]MBQ4830632.1 YIP1 family protein [Alteromonas sp. MMG017]WOI39022.1 Yip1 family protein [Alteromonas sp. CI.11.F.A3]|mmetsp:Transcript_36715/g.96133  ORF Transcript_36715/g.96133 Transcript_36715/m.96133 type:complete len:199 (-) Transcript_36715:95-691(-)
MLLNHVIGMYTHPKEECRNIDRRQETFFYAFSHIAIIALIPTIVAYYSTVYTGWSMGGELIKLSESSALLMATGMYFGLVAGVVALAVVIHELAKAFESSTTFTQSLELAAYTATPLFMVGFAGLYPELWVVMTALLVGVSYSVYLLFSGVPLLMQLPQEKGFIYSSSVVTCGLVLMVILMTGAVLLWGITTGPIFAS